MTWFTLTCSLYLLPQLPLHQWVDTTEFSVRQSKFIYYIYLYSYHQLGQLNCEHHTCFSTARTYSNFDFGYRSKNKNKFTLVWPFFNNHTMMLNGHFCDLLMFEYVFFFSFAVLILKKEWNNGDKHHFKLNKPLYLTLFRLVKVSNLLKTVQRPLS